MDFKRWHEQKIAISIDSCNFPIEEIMGTQKINAPTNFPKWMFLSPKLARSHQINYDLNLY